MGGALIILQVPFEHIKSLDAFRPFIVISIFTQLKDWISKKYPICNINVLKWR